MSDLFVDDGGDVKLGVSKVLSAREPALELTEMLADSAGSRGMGSPATRRVSRAGAGARHAGHEWRPTDASPALRTPERRRTPAAFGGAAPTSSPPSRGCGAPGSPFARDPGGPRYVT